MSEKGMRFYRLNEWCEKLDNKTIEIPKIQRGFVWKPEQIAGLWDSLLRGFPIGSFMIQPKEDNSNLVELLDGQQRGRSIAGGVKYKRENGFRVWIANKSNKSNSEFTFDIKVTTDKHPFGFDNKFKKLSVSQRSKAYKTSLCKKYLSEEKIEDNSFENVLRLINKKNLHNEIDISLDDTTPYSPNTKYVALDELFNKMQKGGDVYQILLSVFDKQHDVSDDEETYFKLLAKSLINLNEQRSFYAIEVSRHLHNETDNEKDIDIEVLFKRVGTGGTALSDLDFAYSLLKQRLDGAEHYITGLLSNNEISSLFSSLDCVDILIRASCFEAFLKSIINEKIDFDKSDSVKSNKKVLYRKINSNEVIIRDFFDSSIIEDCIFDVIKYLKFDENTHQFGLPIQLLQKIPKKLWQMFVIFSYSKRSLDNEDKDLSKAFVRITLYWLLLSPTSGETATIVHQFIKLIKTTIKEENFSSFYFERELISLIQNTTRKNNSYFAKLLSSSVFKELTIRDSDTFKPKNIVEDKYKLTHDDTNLVGRLFWRNKKLLLWLQRSYLHKLNSDVRLKILSDITLFDFDHIIPQHLWSGNSDIARKFKDKYFAGEGHWEIGNSIGNFQLLKFSDNRAKQSATYSDWMKSLKDSKKDVLVDSLLINSDDYFIKTIQKKEWLDDQPNNFVKAVEHRVNDLYTEFLTVFDEDSIYFESKVDAITE